MAQGKDNSGLKEGKMRRLLILAGVSFTFLALILLALTFNLPTESSPPRPTPTPIVTVQGQEEGGVTAQALPDLVIEDITFSPEYPLVNRPAQIMVRIKNQGSGSMVVTNNFFVDLYINPPQPPAIGQHGDISWPVQAVWVRTPGQAYTLTAQYTFTRTNTFNIWAQIDTDGNVRESNEGNNFFPSPETPKPVKVVTSKSIQQVTAQDFQKGFSNLDLSPIIGLIRLNAVYEEPWSEPEIYTGTDRMVSDPVNSIKTEAKILRNPDNPNILYVVWTDGRNGPVYNKDIFFSYSTDGGRTWSSDITVCDKPGNQESPALAYYNGRLYAVWEDSRSSARGYDIYFAYSTDGGLHWTEVGPINDDTSNARQVNPSITVNPTNGHIYVVWQDQRNGNNDIYFAMSTDGGLTWSRNVFVTDYPYAKQQSQSAPAIAYVPPPVDKIYVVWEDDRYDSGDIFFTWGRECSNPDCAPATFHIDQKVNKDDPGARQSEPTIGVSPVYLKLTYSREVSPEDRCCPSPVTQTITFTALYRGYSVHFAWTDYRQDPKGDIFYAWTFEPTLERVSWSVVPPTVTCDVLPTTLDFSSVITCPPCCNCTLTPIYGDVKVKGRDICPTPGCLAPDKPLPSEEQFAQKNPAMASRELWPGMHIAWADNRNYEPEVNYDIFLVNTCNPVMQAPENAPVSVPSPPCHPSPCNECANKICTNYTVCGEPQQACICADFYFEDEYTVNDNVKRHGLLNQDYLEMAPASALQARPSIATSGLTGGSCGCRIEAPYVVWDDNRRDDPYDGRETTRDIYFTRPVTNNKGIYISPIIDVGATAKWYFLEYWGVTPLGTTVTLQTRTGNTPWPDSSWTSWTGPKCVGGKCYYEGPAEIVSPTNSGPTALYPESRYIQYKVEMECCEGCYQACCPPCLSSFRILYEGGHNSAYSVYLPLVLRNY
jgi:hypothetical protein